MKSLKPSLNSFKKLISRKEVKQIAKGNEMGRVVIPVGTTDTEVSLPNVESTTTYSILKTEELTGNLDIINDSVRGYFKGLALDYGGGTLSISKIENGTQTITIDADTTNGARIDFLSDGQDWFVWGATVGNTGTGKIGRSFTGNFSPNSGKDENQNRVEDTLEARLEEQGIDLTNKTPEEKETLVGQILGDIESGTDTIAPDAPTVDVGSIVAGQPTNNNSPEFSGNTEPGATVNLVFNDGVNPVREESAVADENGDWSWAPDVLSPIDDGNYTVTIDVTDNAETPNTSNPTTFNLIVDTTPPVITLNQASPYSATVGAVGADPGATADGGEVVTSDWNEGALNSLAEGQSATITYTATDAAGNTSTAEMIVNIGAAVAWIEEAVLIPDPTYSSIANGILSVNGPAGGDATIDKKFLMPNFILDDHMSTTATQATWSIWFKKTGTTYRNGAPEAGSFAIVTHQNKTHSVNFRIVNQTEVKLGGSYSYPLNSLTIGTSISENVDLQNWHNIIIAISRDINGTETYRALADGSGFWEGQEWDANQNTPIGPSTTTDVSILGFYEQNVIFSSGQFDAFEIKEGVFLNQTQMQALYDAGRGGMTISDASQI